MQRLLYSPDRRRRSALADGQRVLLGFRIIIIFYRYNRRGLTVPAAEMGQIDIRSIFHRLYEVITRTSRRCRHGAQK